MLDNKNNLFLIDIDSITYEIKDDYYCLPTRSYAPCIIFIKFIYMDIKNKM